MRVITALVEGTSIKATVRMTGVAKHTVLNLLRDLGCAAAKLEELIGLLEKQAQDAA